MKYHREGTVYDVRDYAEMPKRGGLFDVLGNAIGAFCLLSAFAIIFAIPYFV